VGVLLAAVSAGIAITRYLKVWVHRAPPPLRRAGGRRPSGGGGRGIR